MKKTTRARGGKAQKAKSLARSESGVQGNGDIEGSPNAFVSYPDEGEGTPSVFACPECHGVLWEIKEGGSVRYRCRTGHAYSEATLSEELSHAAEGALWAAMRALEEKASMSRRMANAATVQVLWRTRLEQQAVTYATHAQMIRAMIFGEPLVVEERVPLKTEKRDQTG